MCSLEKYKHFSGKKFVFFFFLIRARLRDSSKNVLFQNSFSFLSRIILNYFLIEQKEVKFIQSP